MTTRLSNSAKEHSLSALRALLSNVVGFVGCPITDRAQMVELWNTKFPADLKESVRVLGTYRIGMGAGSLTTDMLRWCTEINGELYCALVRLEELGPLSQEKMMQGVLQYAFGTSIGTLAGKGVYREVHLDNKATRSTCIELTHQDMHTVLGADLTDEVISWMRQTAVMRDELIVANRALQAIFDMAQTAGQIKRMVPDLLQYLPVQQRLAFEEQKRSSTVPFDWAPFPKDQVDVMLTQVNKGHLLQNMRKPNRQQASVESLDLCTWSRRDCSWADTKQ
jgi:hypothetical protein